MNLEAEGKPQKAKQFKVQRGYNLSFCHIGFREKNQSI